MQCHKGDKVNFWLHPIGSLVSSQYWHRVYTQAIAIHSKDGSLAESLWGGHGERGAQQTRQRLNAEALYNALGASTATIYNSFGSSSTVPEQGAKTVSELYRRVVCDSEHSSRHSLVVCFIRSLRRGRDHLMWFCRTDTSFSYTGMNEGCLLYSPCKCIVQACYAGRVPRWSSMSFAL